MTTNPSLFLMLCRSAGSSIIKATYGYSVTTDDDYFILMVQQLFEASSAMARPGSWAVDSYPICQCRSNTIFAPILIAVILVQYLPQWFPGGGFRKPVAKLKGLIDISISTLYNWVIDELVRHFRPVTPDSNSLCDN